MTQPTVGPQPDAKLTPHTARGPLYLGLTATVFLSSWLLFSLEPLSARILLPRLGGSPTVWITCLLFFQAALLTGYTYTWLTIRLLGLQRQAILHIALLVLSFAFIPISLRSASLAPPSDNQMAWLLITLATTIGIPFALLSSFAPIAQRWLAHGDSPNHRDPYFLYAASNLGSFLALLSYPLVAEPLLSLRQQSTVWSFTYGAVAAAVIALGWLTYRSPQLESRTTDSIPEASPPPTTRNRARWLIYAAVPSSLLMGTTSYISTDIGSFPLLWVLPLSLYLLSFTLVFARRQVLSHSAMLRAEPQVIVIVALTIFWAISPPGVFNILLHLALLFLIAMVCHGEHVRTRPHPSHLTEFYLWLATGGLIGGIFNAVIAPVAFNEVIEYPIAIVAAALLRPRNDRPSLRLDILAPMLFGGALIAATWRPGSPPAILPTLFMVFSGMILFSFRDHPRRFALALAIVLAVGITRRTSTPSGRNILESERSFFGVYRVLDNHTTRIRTLEHGTTVHGTQSLDSASRLAPLSYYHRDGPAGDIFAFTQAALQTSRRIAVVGLGVGSLACYGRQNEHWTYYEIDPLVAEIATDTTRFTMLRDCPPQVRVIYGDARLELANASPAAYDLILVDAFSSDAIPVHLMTREAFLEYFRVLGRDGVLAVHISNNHMDLQPLVAALAADIGVVALVRSDIERNSDARVAARSASVWVALARNPETLGTLSARPAWGVAMNPAGMRPWTDDFSNILSVIRWR